MLKISHEIALEDINNIFISRDREKDSFLHLVDSIKRFGLIIPITVQKKDDKFEVIKGQGRLEAHKKLGLKKINAYIVDEKISDKEKIGNWLVENVVRKHLSTFDKARMICYEYQKKQDYSEVSKLFGITIQKVKEAVDFFNDASPSVIEKVKEKNLSFTPAKKIVSAVKNKSLQDSVAQLLSVENLDSKSEDTLIKRASQIEKRLKKKGNGKINISVADLRKDIRYLRENVQNKKDILASYDSLWEMGAEAIQILKHDSTLKPLLSEKKIEILAEYKK